MKFKILQYYSQGDQVIHRKTGWSGTVIHGGNAPIIEWETENGSEIMKNYKKSIKLAHPIKTLIKRKLNRYKKIVI